jgi:hypothetical protein
MSPNPYRRHGKRVEKKDGETSPPFGVMDSNSS